MSVVTPSRQLSVSAETDASKMGLSSNSISGSSGARSGNVHFIASIQAADPEFSRITTAPFPPPKTNKPRPHVCETCSRSFTRLEHLKRHERSHTKEKPFECPQCTRGFARRDLLLRHQQKLHQQGATSSRPGNGRRESISSLPPNATGRVRKNSMASSIGGAACIDTSSMRPRANTISHIDTSALNNLLASHNASLARGGEDHPSHAHHANLSGLNGPSTFDYRGMSTSIGNQRHHHGLAKLDTFLGLDLGNELRTASSQGCGPDASELEKLLNSSCSTITPNQLDHFKENVANPQSPFPSPFSNLFTGTASIQEDEFDWSAGPQNFTISCAANETGVNEPLPSAICTTSQIGFSEVMLDGSRQPASAAMGRRNPLSTQHDDNPATYSLDAMARPVPELMTNTISWEELAERSAPANFYIS